MTDSWHDERTAAPAWTSQLTRRRRDPSAQQHWPPICCPLVQPTRLLPGRTVSHYRCLPCPKPYLYMLVLLLLAHCPQVTLASTVHDHNHQHHSTRHQLVHWANSSIASSTITSFTPIEPDLVSSSTAVDAHLSAPSVRHQPSHHRLPSHSRQHPGHYRRWTVSQSELSAQRHKRNLLHQPEHGSNALLKADQTRHYTGGKTGAHYQSDTFSPPPLPPGVMPPPGLMYPSHPMMAALPPLQILPIENVTASVGRNAVLKCVINRPGQYKVAWLKMDDKSELTLLTLGLHPLVTEDEGKYKVTHNERQWLLHVNRVQVSDRGRYMCQINAKTMTSQTGYLDVFEPPVITELTSSDTTVDELQKVSLRCATSGYPSPSVTWRRENGKALNLGLYGGKKHAAKTLDGEYLNISQVTREDMGAYLCIASNGVPPSVSKRIVLQVNFRPKIRVHSQLVSAYLGSDVELECRVEASPKPETVWLSGTGQKLEELLEQLEQQQGGNSSNELTDDGRDYIRTNVNGQSRLVANHHAQAKRKKYQFDEDSDGYRTVMRLTIRRLESIDFGSYKCVAKNSLGEKEGLVRLYEIPVPTLPPTTTTTTTTTAPPRTLMTIDKNPSMTDKWTKSSNGAQESDHPFGVHAANFGGRSLRENQQQGVGGKAAGLGENDRDEDELEDDYELNKYLTEHYQNKKKARKNGAHGVSSWSGLALAAPLLIAALARTLC